MEQLIRQQEAGIVVTGRIQSSDFSSNDFGILTRNNAVTLFQNHNWERELNSKQTQVLNKLKTCPIVMVLINAIGHKLLIFPESNGQFTLHYHLRKKTALNSLANHTRIYREIMKYYQLSSNESIGHIHNFYDNPVLNQYI